jgi:PDZ domain-containing protein
VKFYLRNRWTTAASVLILAVVAAVLLVPVPFLTRSPGPVFDVLGDVGGQPVLKIVDAQSYPTTGILDMTTVSEAGGTSGSLNLLTAVIGLFDPQTSVIPSEDQYPNGPPTEADREVSQKVFAASQSTALAAAANYVGRPVTSQAVVFDVVPGAPADGSLLSGDVIMSVNGEVVSDGAQVGQIVGVLPVGSEVEFEILRDGSEQTVNVKTEAAPVDPEGSADSKKSVVGIFVDNHYESDFRAEITLQDIGGPSAGLVFSMAMVDKLSGDDLLDGKHIAGTGTIAADGAVGPIGGIDKKLIAAKDAGAGIFLAPADNCADVVSATPDGLTVIPVNSLTEAIASAKDWLANRDLPTCPVDTAAEQSS